MSTAMVILGCKRCTEQPMSGQLERFGIVGWAVVSAKLGESLLLVEILQKIKVNLWHKV